MFAGKHGLKGMLKPNIFTEYYLRRLAKAGICFTFPPHKVRITTYRQAQAALRFARPFRLSGSAIIP
ncbi:hypothetical protein CO704_01665 [Cedecea neteri]|uniref:Uncharacterized protein n=1 Tax=Cedecea neteri TaxID=158822 RepID=A0A291DT50_9ENTR|nr:hypothetical protein CO704_01665 [Cedecea neteri]